MSDIPYGIKGRTEALEVHYRSGLLSFEIRHAHDISVCISEEVVPDPPYDQVGAHISRDLMPNGRSGGILFLSFGRWWR